MSVKNTTLIKRIAPVSIVPLLLAQQVMAQTANKDVSTTSLEEIIVTATRQAVGSQSTAIALTAVSGDDLAKSGVTSVTQLNTMAPSLYVQEGISSGSPRFSLRGISSADPGFQNASPVALYLDDVYQTAIYGTSGQLFDVDHIEVLRGPQGTLFGKNTTGGAISYFSKEPVNGDEGYASFHIAQDHQSERRVEGVINTALVDNLLALRVSVNSERLGDNVTDVGRGVRYGAADSQAIRAQLKWTPSENTKINLLVAANDHHGVAPSVHAQYLPNVCDPYTQNNNGAAIYLCDGSSFFPPAVGTPKPTPELNPDTVAQSDIPQPENYYSQHFTLRIYQTFPGFTLTSISHYKRGHYLLEEDGDGAPGDYLGIYSDQKNAQIGQELRIATDPAKRVSAVIGGYYQHDRLREATAFASISGNADPFTGTDFNESNYSNNLTTTYALFGNVTFKITDQWSLVGGVRKSNEHKKVRGRTDYFTTSSGVDWTPQNVIPTAIPVADPTSRVILDQDVKASPWTWEGSVNFTPVENVLTFVRVARSFRSGGFNGADFINPAPQPGDPPQQLLDVYKPETITSYELGIKSELLNHTLRINAGVYHYEYKDQQVNGLKNGQLLTTNAGASKVDGAELEIKALPVERLELSANVGYTKAQYKSYVTRGFTDPVKGVTSDNVSYAGNTLVQAPKITANASIAYTFDVSDKYELRPSTSWSYRSKIYFDPSNNPALSSGALTQGNVRLDFEQQNGKGFSVGAFVNNVTNKRYFTYATALPPIENIYTYNSTGRQYGLDMRYSWR